LLKPGISAVTRYSSPLSTRSKIAYLVGSSFIDPGKVLRGVNGASISLKELLEILQQRELIRYEKGSRLYKITERGLRFMNAYDKISELFTSAEERNSLFDGGNTSPLLQRIETYSY